jgi:hypothetical protein
VRKYRVFHKSLRNFYTAEFGNPVGTYKLICISSEYIDVIVFTFLIILQICFYKSMEVNLETRRESTYLSVQ